MAKKKKNIYIYIYMASLVAHPEKNPPATQGRGFDGLAGYESMGLQKSQIQLSD